MITLVVIVSAVVAALLAGGFALAGVALGDHRGRQAWARDKRLEAAADLLTQADRTIIRLAVGASGLPQSIAPPLSASEIPSIFVDLVEMQSRLMLLGPDEVAEASKKLVGTMLRISSVQGKTADDEQETRRAREAFIAAVRHALRTDSPL